METIFHRIGNSIKLAPGIRILRAADYARLLEAQQLLDDASAEAEAILKRAEEAYQERQEQGYKDGVLEGQMEQAEKMLETGMQAVQYLEGLERQIVDVVTTAVRKIIGEMDDKERIVRIVRTALDQVRGRQHVLIRVCPEEEPYVREALAPMLGKSSLSRALELVADQHMKPGDCMLESEMGVVDAGLEIQLRAIENALTARIGENES
ncbi:MAG: HrpE/YscL family type III secretion apparatus protein [Desulfovibrio sp.]|nr:HrpE/YscL family type III secretion apparatus protein [Desulfovibrio sp.]